MGTWPQFHPMFRFKKFKSISDLSIVRPRQLTASIPQIRKDVMMALVDNEAFPYFDVLRSSYQYNITYFPDLSRIDQIGQYPIVLCDLNGTGAAFSSELQGSQLIKQIKTTYPEKIVVAYTGGAPPKVEGIAMKYANEFIKKDEDIDVWVQILDKKIEECIDPILFWKANRARILEYGASPYQLAIVEDAFIEFLKDSQKTPYEVFIKAVTNVNTGNRHLVDFMKSAGPLLSLGIKLLSSSHG